MKIYDNFSCVFEIADQLLAHHSLYLALWLNGNACSFWSVNQVGFFLLVRCFYNKQNNKWLLGDLEFLVECSKEISSWTLEEKFHLSACPCIILYVFQSSSVSPEFVGSLVRPTLKGTKLKGRKKEWHLFLFPSSVSPDLWARFAWVDFPDVV